MLFSLTKGDADGTTELAVTTAVEPDERLTEVMSDGHGTAVADLAGLVGTGLRLARDGVGQLLRLATRTAPWLRPARGRTTRVLGDLLFSHNPDTPLSGEPSGTKRIRWSGPLPLADAKQLGRLAGATLNDVLMSAVRSAAPLPARQRPGAGGPHHDGAGQHPAPRRAASARARERLRARLFPFPSGLSAPLDRLAETKRRMDRIKRSPEAVITFAIINAIGHLSATVARIFVDFFANKTIGVTTNVAGPRPAGPWPACR